MTSEKQQLQRRATPRRMETQPADLLEADRMKLSTAITALHDIAMNGEPWARHRAETALRSIELGHW